MFVSSVACTWGRIRLNSYFPTFGQIIPNSLSMPDLPIWDDSSYLSGDAVLKSLWCTQKPFTQIKPKITTKNSRVVLHVKKCKTLQQDHRIYTASLCIGVTKLFDRRPAWALFRNLSNYWNARLNRPQQQCSIEASLRCCDAADKSRVSMSAPHDSLI